MKTKTQKRKNIFHHLLFDGGQGSISTIAILIAVGLMITVVVAGVSFAITPGEVTAPLEQQVQNWDARTNPGEAAWDAGNSQVDDISVSADDGFWSKTKNAFSNLVSGAADSVNWIKDQANKVGTWWNEKAAPWFKGIGEGIANWWENRPGWVKGLITGIGVAAVATLVVAVTVGTGGLALPLIIGGLAAAGAGSLYGLSTDNNPNIDFNLLHAIGWSAVGWAGGFLSTGGAPALIKGIAPKIAGKGIGKAIIKGLSRAGASSLSTILLTWGQENRMPTAQEMAIYVVSAVAVGAILDGASSAIYKALSKYQGGGQWAWQFLEKVKLGKLSAWLRNHQTIPNLLQNDLVKEILKTGADLEIVPGFIGLATTMIGNMEGPKMFIRESSEQIIKFFAETLGR